MLTTAASASFIPAPDADPAREPGRGTLQLFGGVLFDELSARRPQRRATGESLQILERFARVLILEEGSATPKEAIIAAAAPITVDDLEALEAIPAEDLVAESNLAASRVLHDEPEVSDGIRRLEFDHHMKTQDSIEFLFSNLVAKQSGAALNLFSAYFAPGGDIDGVGVYLNSWL
ncbi:MAG: hypothetical protein IT463_00425 [Planctomycetes bacterium]|nr:hypothetical protein [Planctomycetota bacterium]